MSEREQGASEMEWRLVARASSTSAKRRRRWFMTRTTAGVYWLVMCAWNAEAFGWDAARGKTTLLALSVLAALVCGSLAFHYLTHPVKP